MTWCRSHHHGRRHEAGSYRPARFVRGSCRPGQGHAARSQELLPLVRSCAGTYRMPARLGGDRRGPTAEADARARAAASSERVGRADRGGAGTEIPVADWQAQGDAIRAKPCTADRRVRLARCRLGRMRTDNGMRVLAWVGLALAIIVFVIAMAGMPR